MCWNMSEKIGMTKREAKAKIERLLKRKAQIQQDMKTTPLLGQQATMRIELNAIEEETIKVRDEYSVGVLESLEVETRTLKWLTVVLIALTVVLAVFTGLLVSGVKLP